MESGTFKCKGERNDHMIHHEQVFGDVFKRKESKCHVVLMKHCHNVKGKHHSPNGSATKKLKILMM